MDKKWPSSDPDEFPDSWPEWERISKLNPRQKKALEHRQQKRAHRIAGVSNLKLVDQVVKAVHHAVTDGETLADFKKRVGKKLVSEWAGTVANPGSRIETIFRTNVQTAYQAGRMREMLEPDTLELRPFWRFSAILDMRTSDVCAACNGTLLPARAGWWGTHTPPLHHRCRSFIDCITMENAHAQGVTNHPSRDSADNGFGSIEQLENWEPDLSGIDPGLLAVYRSRREG